MSRQPTIEESVGKSPLFRYAIGFHYSGEYMPLIEWLDSRFEIECVKSLEISKTGLTHIHAYGETKYEVTKSDRQMFQGKGKYAKYMNKGVKKKYWIKPAKKDRHRNIMYCMKRVKRDGFEAVVREINPTIDDGIMNVWIDEAQQTDMEIHHSTSTTFQDKLIDWYLSLPLGVRPTKLLDIIRGLLTSDIIPWGNMPNSRLVASAEWLYLSRHNPERLDAIAAKMYSVEQYLEKNNMSHM